VFRAQADWTFILPLELPIKELRHLPRKMPLQAYQTSQYVVPCGSIFLDEWRSAFAGNSDGKMNVQSACSLNTLHIHILINLASFFCIVPISHSIKIYIYYLAMLKSYFPELLCIQELFHKLE
jgi:hypothetical protein